MPIVKGVHCVVCCHSVKKHSRGCFAALAKIGCSVWEYQTVSDVWMEKTFSLCNDACSFESKRSDLLMVKLNALLGEGDCGESAEVGGS